MFGFIFGIIIIVVGIIIAVTLNKTADVNSKKKALIVPVLAATIIVGGISTVSGMTANVNTGNTGVVVVFGKVEDKTFDAGFHIKAPWESVIEMDNRVQKATSQLPCFSSDIQEVNIRYTLNYQIDKENAQEIYKNIGTDYYNIVIEPTIAECVKVVTAQYTAEQLVQTRSTLAKGVEDLLTEQLAKYNIKVSSTAIEDMDFTDAFTNAVEAKQVAEQAKKQALIEYAQALEKAENEKQIAIQQAEILKTQAEANAAQAKIKAEADAEVAKIQANADLEVQKINSDAAEYSGKKESQVALQRLAGINGWSVIADEATGINKLTKPDGTLVNDTELTNGVQKLIEYYYTQTWDGVLPETLVTDGSISSIILNNNQ